MSEQLPDSGKRSEFETGAVRDASEGKGFPSLLPPDALRAAARRFEDGALKYGRNNWQKGIPLSRYVDSLYRHLWQYIEGDTTEDHGGAIIWNAMCLVQTEAWISKGILPETLLDLEGEIGEQIKTEGTKTSGQEGRDSGGHEQTGPQGVDSVGAELQSHEADVRKAVRKRQEELARRDEKVSE